jgi:hypothetical protein
VFSNFNGNVYGFLFAPINSPSSKVISPRKSKSDGLFYESISFTMAYSTYRYSKQ